ncbi:ankyrin repeat-containing domain protein [Immersiella caudata]|uniref:Ankyrin repeat-containing domain protein n=1 Tax=Immersiella caudata TaxID=314043 RepID=A0AA39W485_9PEZI|nr:ankyrin repeat-containing domain protein [Immersiella caudata]
MQPSPQEPTRDAQPSSASADSNDSDEKSAIVKDLCAASRNGNVELVKQVLASQVGKDWSEDDVAIAASGAAEGGHLDIVRLFLDRELFAGPAALSLGSVPLLQALYEIQKWTTEEINEYMANWPNLEMSTFNGKLDALQWWLDRGMDPNLEGNPLSSGIRGMMTPLAAVARNARLSKDASDYIAMLELLFKSGAKVPRWAVENAITWRRGHRYNLDVLKWLLGHGADINCPFPAGSSLLHGAVDKRNLELVKFLVENGIDMSIKDRKGQTALERAQKFDLTEIASVIGSASGAKGE